jgi:hypothetical protein
MTGRHAALGSVVPYYAWVPLDLYSTLTRASVCPMPYPLCKTSPPYSIDAFQLLVFCFDKLNRYAREHEDAVGWTRDQRRVCGAVKRRDGVSL